MLFARKGIMLVSIIHDLLITRSCVWMITPLILSGGKIWRAHLPEKLHYFMWQICQTAFPTNNKRVSCKLAQSIACPRCFLVDETTLHVLRDCPHRRELWNLLGILIPPIIIITYVKEWVANIM